MDKLDNLRLLCVILVIFVAGCGKKKESPRVDGKETTMLASVDNDIPLLKEETESLLEDGDIADFAFADDEMPGDLQKETLAVAEREPMEVENVLVEADNGVTPSYAFKTVKFDLNKNDIRTDQKNVVTEDVEIAKQAVEEGKQVVIEGHTCQIGSAAYNLALSQRRAQAIKTEMCKHGVAEENIKTIGYGYERPVIWSDAKDRGQLVKELSPNRRAEILVN